MSLFQVETIRLLIPHHLSISLFLSTYISLENLLKCEVFGLKKLAVAFTHLKRQP